MVGGNPPNTPFFFFWSDNGWEIIGGVNSGASEAL